MLNRLTLKNIALIEHAEIDFTAGLNVLSGETGAGKSVIIDSFNFVLGAKADRSMIRYGENSCFVSAEFTLDAGSAARQELVAQGFDDDELLVITRKFNADGRGEIRVNGMPVNATMLRKITSHLVDVHGQSEHFSLLGASVQLSVIDKFGGETVSNALAEYKSTYHAIGEVKKKLRGGGDEQQRALRMDVLRYQIDEIERAAFEDDEEDELLSRKEKLDNAEKIMQSLSIALQAIDSDSGALDSLRAANRYMQDVTAYGDEFAEVYDRMEACFDALNDISGELSSLREGAEFDPEEAEQVVERIDLLKKLKRKYGGSIQQINEFLQQSKEEYEGLEHFEEINQALLKELDNLQNQLVAQAKTLSNARKAAAKTFAENVLSELTELGMPKASFVIDFLQADGEDILSVCTANGMDTPEFMFSANAGEPVKPMSKVISGGEMSRLMLAIKTQTAKLQDISTYVFDEIDAGISGLTAQTVAEKFAKIAVQTQIIAITHLPQISAISDTGLLIEKTEQNGKTQTFVHTLTEQTKTLEVARLIGGTAEDATALAHATNMIRRAQQIKRKYL